MCVSGPPPSLPTYLTIPRSSTFVYSHYLLFFRSLALLRFNFGYLLSARNRDSDKESALARMCKASAPLLHILLSYFQNGQDSFEKGGGYLSKSFKFAVSTANEI